MERKKKTVRRRKAMPQEEPLGRKRTWPAVETAGIVLIAVGVFLLCALTGIGMGSLGIAVAQGVKFCFGLVSYVVPLVFLVLGWRMAFQHRTYDVTQRSLVWALLVVSILGLVHLLRTSSGVDALSSEALRQGGGLVGGALVYILLKVVGSIGAGLILVTLTVCSLVLTGKFSVKTSTEKAKESATVAASQVKRKYATIKEKYHSPTQEEKRAPQHDFTDYPPTPRLSSYEEEVARTRQRRERGYAYAHEEKVNSERSEVQRENASAKSSDLASAKRSYASALSEEEKLASLTVNKPASSACTNKVEEKAESSAVVKEHQARDLTTATPKSTETKDLSSVSLKKPQERNLSPADLDESSEKASLVQGATNKQARTSSDAQAEQEVELDTATKILHLSPLAGYSDPPASGTTAVLTFTGVYHGEEEESPDKDEQDSSREDGQEAKDVPPPRKVNSSTSYTFPPLSLLKKPAKPDYTGLNEEVTQQTAIIEQTLKEFGVGAKVVGVTKGPAVTRFELVPDAGVKVAKIQNLADDLALKLAAAGIRIEPIVGKAAIGVEVPSNHVEAVDFYSVVSATNVVEATGKLIVGLGKDISGNIVTANLAKMPHLLVAGSTGSGKSVCINTIIAGLLYRARPDEVKLILVDPKVVELTNYNDIPHLLTPVVTSPKKAASALHWAVGEMERRYELFAKTSVRDMEKYNEVATEKLPFIVIIIDELADLMMVAPQDVEEAILRLAQKARAAGIHMILATQRPSVDVITGIVKANIPSRIAFAVSSQVDSRTILDLSGAEKLLGKGDMLFYPIGKNKPLRVQGAFVSDEELERLVAFIKAQQITTTFDPNVTVEQVQEAEEKATGSDREKTKREDELFTQAVRLVMELGHASASLLQRKLRIGFTRAARLVDGLEEKGIVGRAEGSKPRVLLMSKEEIMRKFLSNENDGGAQ